MENKEISTYLAKDGKLSSIYSSEGDDCVPKNRIRVSAILFISIFLISTFLLIKKSETRISDAIIGAVNGSCEDYEPFAINMSDLITFNWDKLLVIEEGCTNSEISDVLGFNYNEPKTMSSGFKFVFKNEIVHSEMYELSPSEPSLLCVGPTSNKVKCYLLDRDEAIIYVTRYPRERKSSKGNDYYYVIYTELKYFK